MPVRESLIRICRGKNGEIHRRADSGLILKDYKGKKIYLLAPLVRSRKGHYRELFEQIRKKGYLYVRVDGKCVKSRMV